MAIANLLKDIYFFQAFTPKELQQVEPVCERTVVNAGEAVFRENDPAAALYVIEIGTLRVTKSGEDTEIVQLGKGSTFGEMPFFDHGKRSATATATERTHLIKLDYEKLQAVLQAHSELALKFYTTATRFLAARLRATTADLTRLSG